MNEPLTNVLKQFLELNLSSLRAVHYDVHLQSAVGCCLGLILCDFHGVQNAWKRESKIKNGRISLNMRPRAKITPDLNSMHRDIPEEK